MAHGDDAITQKILNRIKCPVCLDYMLPPIIPCLRGHNFCKPCRSEYEKCPCCHRQFTNIRNSELESLVNRTPVPCSYALWGCPISLRVNERTYHKTRCGYRALICRDMKAKCFWVGTLEKFKEHCRLPNHVLIQSGTFLPMHIFKNPHFSFTISFLDELFLVRQKFNAGNNMIYWSAQLIGDGDKAAKFMYQSIYIGDRFLFNECGLGVPLADIRLITPFMNEEFQLCVKIATV